MAISILIVDEELEILDSIGTALKQQKFDAHVAYNSNDAIEILKDKNIDIMITDVRLSGEDDFHLVQFSRKMIKYRNMPIVAITSDTDPELIEKGKENNIDTFLTKPIEFEKLYAILGKIVKKLNLMKAGELRKEVATVKLKALKALIVDDEDSITEMLKEFLEEELENVFTAPNVKEAQYVIEENQIDVMITDIKMPDQSGFDLVEWVNEQPMSAGIPIMMMTGVKKDIDSVKKAKNLYIDKYLIKPFDLKQVKQGLVEICADKYRQEKYKKFSKMYIELDEDAQKEEQNMLHQIRTQILKLKKDINVAIKDLRLLSKDAPAQERYKLEEKLEALETKAKDFQERMNMTKTDFFARKKELVAIKRGISQRLDKIR
ncbi:response regulator [candidate division KSB1 bacterium]